MTLYEPPLDQSYRYWAFISYSHADERWARWLHRALEGYRIPRDLVGTTGRFGPFPDRLFPIFRDREELASSSSLPAQLREALARARVLVVICSPRAAQSRWVSEEIRAFKALGRENEVFCVIVDGEPYASSGARSVDECLPEPIRRRVDHDGRLLDEPAEPLAADARPTGDGKNGVVVKLVAGILGVGLDVLRRRDEQRRRRRARGWAAVGLATIAALSLGIWYTNERRIEAEEATRRADVAARAESEARKAEELARIDAEDKRALAERREREAREARLAEEQQKREAIKQRDLAEERRTIALARQLAAQSTTVLNQFPDRLPLAVLLALESTRLHPSFESNQALRAGLTLLALAIQRYAYSGPDPVRGRIRGLAFSPDRKYLAVARDDGTAEVLDLLQGTVAILHHQENPGAVVNLPGGGFQWKAPGVDAEVTSLAFSPDGRLLATGNNDRTARLWDMASGREIRRLQHGAAVSSVAFHPAGTYLATGSKEGKARIFDAGTGQPALEIRHEREVRIHEFKLEPGARVAEQVVESKQVEEVRQVAFSPDGRYLAAISTDGRVSLLSLETKQLHRSWYAGASGLGLAFSRDGKKLATANGDFAFVWEVETGKQLLKATHGPSAEEAVGHNVWVDTVAVSPDGNYLATGGRDGTARVWNLSSGQERVRLKHGSTVETVAFGVDGTTLTTGSYHGARLWEIPSGRERLRAAGANEVVVFSPDGARVASGGGDGDVSVWNLGRGDQLAQMAHSGAVRTMSFSPDGSKLATADDKGRVRLWSSAGELKAELKQPAFGPTRLVFSHDGRFLAAGARNPYLFIMNVEQDLAATSLATFRDAGDYVLSPRYVAAEGRDHRHVRIWETSGGRELTQIEALDLSAIKFDSTGTFLAIRQMDARGRSGTIRIWDLAHARERGRLAIKDRGEFALAPRGQFLTLAASEPGEKKFSVNHYADVWDVSTVRRVSRIPQDDTVAFIAFDPSGKRLLTIAGNFRNQQREVRVWELPTGKLKARLTHEEEIDAIRFSSEPDTLATLSAGRVYVWNLATSELLSQVTEASHIRDLRFSPDGRHLLTGSADGTAALWLWKTEDLRTEACKRLARNLSAAEWQHYLGGTKYQTSCPNLIVNERR